MSYTQLSTICHGQCVFTTNTSAGSSCRADPPGCRSLWEFPLDWRRVARALERAEPVGRRGAPGCRSLWEFPLDWRRVARALEGAVACGTARRSGVFARPRCQGSRSNTAPLRASGADLSCPPPPARGQLWVHCIRTVHVSYYQN